MLQFMEMKYVQFIMKYDCLAYIKEPETFGRIKHSDIC